MSEGVGGCRGESWNCISLMTRCQCGFHAAAPGCGQSVELWMCRSLLLSLRDGDEECEFP